MPLRTVVDTSGIFLTTYVCVSAPDVSLVLYVREAGRRVDVVLDTSVDSNQGGAEVVYGRTLLSCTQRTVQAMLFSVHRICTQRSVSVYV